MIAILHYIIRLRIGSNADDVNSISRQRGARTRTDRGEQNVIITIKYKMIILLYDKKSSTVFV